MPRYHPSGTVSPDRVPGHRPEPESLPYAYLDGTGAISFNGGLEAAVTAEPFAAVLSHQRDNPVADLEEALLENGMLLRRDQLLTHELGARFHRDGDGLQGPLQIRDRHSDLVHIVVAQGRGEFGAGQGRMRRQF